MTHPIARWRPGRRYRLLKDVSILRVVLLCLPLAVPAATACAADAGDAATSGSSGVIVDPAGSPLAGVEATYYLLTPTAQLASRPGHTPLNSQPMQQLGTVKPTDEHGTFYIDRRATGTGILSVNVEPYAQALVPVSLPRQGIRVQLSEDGATVRGTVRNLTTGQPVAGADVTARPQVMVQWQNGPADKPTTLSLAGQAMRATTDADGRYVIDRLPPGRISMEARADDLINVPPKVLGNPAVQAVAGQPVDAPDLGVYAGHTVSGRVLDKSTGQPIPGATVNVGLGSVSSQSSSKLSTVTDEKGQYTLNHLGPWIDTAGLGDMNLLTFMFISAEAPNYRKEKFTPTAPKTFSPENLTIGHDFELVPAVAPR